jgi:acyl-CoA reductase-like NAD-dependent aldehyde dehydrogenase
MRQGVFVRAENSAEAWGRLSPSQRGRFLARLRGNIVWRQEEIIRTVASESGKPVTEVAGQEVTAALETLRYFEKKYPSRLKERKFRCLRPGFWTKSNIIVFEPLGLIAVIGPSNFPFSLPLLASCAGLMCGNAVILKPSERCPKTSSLMRSLFSESGFPESAFTLVEGGPETARKVAANPSVRKVIVIGSYETGREMAEICGRHFKPCILELGGECAAIVCPDADLAWAARGLAWSAFSAAGRSCVGTKHVLVHTSVGGRLASLLKQETRVIRAGDILDPSADVDAGWPPELRFAGRLGAPPAAGGEAPGPVLLVREVGSIDQAVEAANSLAFGLGASVWSRDLDSAAAIARKLNVGMVWINDAGIGLPQFPWGGTKRSGWGRLFGELALTELIHLKVISSDRPLFSSRKFWWFPYSRQKTEILTSLNSFLYGKKTARRLIRLARAGMRYIGQNWPGPLKKNVPAENCPSR